MTRCLYLGLSTFPSTHGIQIEKLSRSKFIDVKRVPAQLLGMLLFSFELGVFVFVLNVSDCRSLGTPVLFGDAGSKAKMLRDRFELIHQRLKHSMPNVKVLI